MTSASNDQRSATLVIDPDTLSLAHLAAADRIERFVLGEQAWENIRKGHQCLQAVMSTGQSVYGINTGFGPLSSKVLSSQEYETLQQRLLLSNAAGVGEPLAVPIVKLIMVLKLAALSHGASGVSPALAETLLEFLNRDIIPVIPAQGSVGASGDLAPLAHLGLALMGVGEVFHRGVRCAASAALDQEQLQAYRPQAKEGLAIVNGTQVSTALAVHAFFRLERLFLQALLGASLSLEAGHGSMRVLDARLHRLRGQAGQMQVATWMREWLQGSEIQASLKETGPARMQDPYCLRCVPQVMGAVLDQMRHVAGILNAEINAVTDNPIFDLETGDVMYGGNFHAQPVGQCADIMAMCFSELGAMSERRTAFLVDTEQSGLPAFLVRSQGLDSGFMVAQVTAAALASENKSLCYPASVDSIPTAANLEDYVSMATHAAHRLLKMADNAQAILAIEWLAGAQGLSLQRPARSSAALERLYASIREQVPYWQEDRFFAPDIELASQVADTLVSELVATEDYGLASQA